MNLIKTALGKLAAWRRYRGIVNELSQFSDNELSDIGLCRVDIGRVARECVSR
jgi:uncharacterized protein YjiS (DUF1127 family)